MAGSLAEVLLPFFFFLKNVFIFRQRGREVEREEEKHQCVVVSSVPPCGELSHNPDTCLDWEWNLQPFGSLASTESTEPCQFGGNTSLMK